MSIPIWNWGVMSDRVMGDEFKSKSGRGAWAAEPERDSTGESTERKWRKIYKNMFTSISKATFLPIRIFLRLISPNQTQAYRL